MAPTLRLVGEDVLFASWPVDAEHLATFVPDPLTVETYDGTGWVTILTHEVTSAGIDGVPISPVPAFGEVDVRTYVRHGSDTGVRFLACYTGQRLNTLIGGRAFGLPYRHARIDINRRGKTITVRSQHRDTGVSGRFDVRYRPREPPEPAASDSHAAFIAERHAFFVPETDAEVMRVGTVERDPWQLARVEASIRTNTLLDALGIEPAAETPIVRYSPRFVSRFTGTEEITSTT